MQGSLWLVTVAAGTTKAVEDVCTRHRLSTLRAMGFHHSGMCEGACSVVVHAYVNCSLAIATADEASAKTGNARSPNWSLCHSSLCRQQPISLWMHVSALQPYVTAYDSSCAAGIGSVCCHLSLCKCFCVSVSMHAPLSVSVLLSVLSNCLCQYVCHCMSPKPDAGLSSPQFQGTGNMLLHQKQSFVSTHHG